MEDAKRLNSLFRDFGGGNFFVQGENIVVPEAGPVLLEGTFVVSLDPQKTMLRTFICELHDKYIFLRPKKGAKVLAVLNIDYALLKLMKDIQINDTMFSSLRFSKNKSYEELYTADYKQAEKWYVQLKRMCIRSKFRSYFRCDEVLGKGAFAKVYSVTRNSDGAKFAAKIFDKKLIVKDALEVVRRLL